MAINRNLSLAHIYLELARACSDMAKYHAIENPMRAMELDMKYAEYLTMARNHLNQAKKERKK